MTLQQQMFILSDCLLTLGYRKLALLCQQAIAWEFADDLVDIAVQEAKLNRDIETLRKLKSANLILGYGL